jgi:predicted transposase YbfD/YdcC
LRPMRRRPASCWRKRGVRAEAHEAELSVAPAIVAALPLAGRVVTGDALYAQRALCQQIRAAGGDYLFIVKRNQPALYADIALLFAAPPPGDVFQEAEQRGTHGDRHDVRRLWASTALAASLDWPGVRQVLQVERVVERQGRRQREVRSAITSLGPAVGAARLLELVRGHWAIENRLHWVRDVTLGEDACRVRTGAAPHVLAALRNVVLALLRRRGVENVAAALREHGWRPNGALHFLGLAPARVEE